MTPEELREIRRRAGLSQRALARVFRLGANGGRTIRRYEAGEIAPSGPVLKLYRLLDAGRLPRDDVAE